MPIDDKLEILGASSDHLIVDVSDSNTSYKVGDIITFRMGYGALLKGFTSEYIEKELL
ncbi:Ornithine racemase [bioreactor metagenome]